MPRLNQSPPGNRIQIQQSEQRIRITLPDAQGVYLLVFFLMMGLNITLFREGLNALQTESWWTTSVLIPWGAAIVALAIAALSAVSRPLFYVDLPDAKGDFRFQWMVGELMIEPRSIRLKLLSPWRSNWIYISQREIEQIQHIDKAYWAMGRRDRAQYCLLRTAQGDYMIGSHLSRQEREWLASELLALFAKPTQS